MEAYQSFAQVYDLFMKEVPYDEWVEYIEQIWKKFNCTPKLMLELGCGTGNMSILFAKKEIEMIGIDVSENMLSIAREKAFQNNVDVLYLQQDMREFELYGTVDCIISVCDSLNYILDEEELLQTFKWVNNYLNPKGLFIFDLNTEYKYKCILGENTFVENEEEASYIWENNYDDEDKLNEYQLTLFIKHPSKEYYSKFEEFHYEKMYSIETITHLIKEAGMEMLAVYDAYTFDTPKENSERIYFVTREKGK